MPSYHALQPGHCYRVVREFADCEGQLHPVGETWEFAGSTFVPYDDSLTLYIRVNGLPLACRLYWLPEEQQFLIEHFTDYVAPC